MGFLLVLFFSKVKTASLLPKELDSTEKALAKEVHDNLSMPSVWLLAGIIALIMIWSMG